MLLELRFDKLLTTTEINKINKLFLIYWNRLDILEDDTELCYRVEENQMPEIEEKINIHIKNNTALKYIKHLWLEN